MSHAQAGNWPLRRLLGLAVAFVSCWLGRSAVCRAADEIRISADRESVTIRDGERRIAEYRLLASPKKPYLKSWTTPGGVNVLRDAPHDHLHHHALMFAIGADGVDFWGEQEGAGRQVHESLEGVFSRAKDGVCLAGFTQRIDWVGPGEAEPRLQERRTLELREASGGAASILTWRSRLTPGPEKDKVILDGRHYFGLGMRFVIPMDDGGRFLNAASEEGEVVRGTEKLVRASWCAYSAKVDDQPVTVAMFDYPENPRHPATWFTMTAPFAYLSATLNLHREPLPLEAGQTLDLRYGVAIWDGRAAPEAIEALYREWLERERSRPRNRSGKPFLQPR